MNNIFSKIVLILSMFIISFSCSSKANLGVRGIWSIDTLYYEGHDSRHCLYVNTIYFKKEEVDLPITGNRCDGLSVFEKNGNWLITKSDSTEINLKIETQNEIFSGNHKLIFVNDFQNKLLKIEIRSKNLFMVARKGLFDYDANKSLIEKLCTSQ